MQIEFRVCIKTIGNPAFAPLAQLAEQVTLNHWVAGSIPARCNSPHFPPGECDLVKTPHEIRGAMESSATAPANTTCQRRLATVSGSLRQLPR